MMVSCFSEKLGNSVAECKRVTKYSRMTETDLDPKQVGWWVMVSKEDTLRAWLQKMIDTNELGAVGEAPPDLAAELGVPAANLDPEVDVDDVGQAGDVEVVATDATQSEGDTPVADDVTESESDHADENVAENVVPALTLTTRSGAGGGRRDSSDSDDDLPLTQLAVARPNGSRDLEAFDDVHCFIECSADVLEPVSEPPP